MERPHVLRPRLVPLGGMLAIAVAAKDTAGTSRRLKAADEVAQPLFVEHWLPMQPGAIRVERPAKPKAD